MKKTFIPFTRSLLVILLTTMGLSSHAQISFGESNQGGAINIVTIRSSDESLTAKGSPYLNEGFQKGEILFENEKISTGFLRFNAYSQEVQIKQNQENYGVLEKKIGYTAIISKDTLKIQPYINSEGKTRTAYFKVLNQGPVKLLIKPEIRLKRGKKAETPYERDQAPKYFRSFKYYIQEKESPATQVKLKRSQILSTLKTIRNQIQQIAEDHDLNYRKESDVIELFNTYNKITEDRG